MGDLDSQAIPIIQTKLNRPPVPIDLVPRPRLTEWLDRRRQRPLTLVSASAGYGKSTLISRWLESIDSPNAWLSLDDGDNDLAVFLSYFLSAVKSMFPEATANTESLLMSSELPLMRLLNDLLGFFPSTPIFLPVCNL